MKMCHIYAMKYHSAGKKSKIMTRTDKRMELENTLLREETQTQRDKCLMFSLDGS